MPSRSQATTSSAADSRVRHHSGAASVSRKSDDSFASAAVYTSHYTSLVRVLQSFAKEDVLVAKIVRLRDSAQGALHRVSQVAAAAARPREPSRGRPRYRDGEYR